MPATAPRKPAAAPALARPVVAAPARVTMPARPSAVAVSGPPAVRLGVPVGPVAPGEMELRGQTAFAPPAPIAEFLEARRGGMVNVRFGSLAQGPITVTRSMPGRYKITRQAIPLTHPLFARVAAVAPGLAPALVLESEGGRLGGKIGLMAATKVESLDTRLRQAPELLGLAGISLAALPAIVNTIEGGRLRLGVKGGPVQIGGAFQGTISLELIDDVVTFTGGASVNAKGLASGNLELKRDQDGLITGKASIGVGPFKNLSGKIDVTWDGQAIAGEGKVGYSGEKLSGEVTLRLLEKGRAEQLEQASKAPDAAALAPPDPKRRAGRVQYVVFGEGDLNFSFTSWLGGTAHVIVDPKGCVTVVGKIAPQKELILFEQKDYVRQLFKLEARASYGIPVVGNIFIFANVGMDAFAKLGPAKLYNIAVEGTYSTDPTKAKSFSIRGSLNISAAAGLRLRGEAGAGLEILAHDIKAGAGINAIAGIKGYAEATPIVGYREKAEPGQDKKGEFFIRGELEIATMPFLGLGGDLFVEVDAPWWSPVPDKKWTWPLASKEWPIGGSFGIGASVDYVLGSGQVPKLDFKPVEFSASKFMTDLYTDKAKSGGGERSAPGKWQEKGSKAAATPPKTSPRGNAAPGKLAATGPARAKVQPGRGPKRDRPVNPAARTATGKTVGQYQNEAAKKGKGKGAVAATKTKSQPSTGADQKDCLSHKINMNGFSHTVESEAQGRSIRFYMATRREELSLKLTNLAETWKDAQDQEIRIQGQALASRLNSVKQRQKALASSYTATPDHAQRHKLAVAGVNEISTLLISIANEFGVTAEEPQTLGATAFKDSGLSLGRATHVYADPITFMSLVKNPRVATPAAGKYLVSRYVDGHLLPHNIGGPGISGNLVAISRGTNNRFSKIENPVTSALRGSKKKLPDPRTVLRYEVFCEYEKDPCNLLEAWMRRRYEAKLPGAHFEGVGQMIINSVSRQEPWSVDLIAKHLRVHRLQILPFSDDIKSKTAQLYLAKGFIISINVHSGIGVSLKGDTFSNHLEPGGAKFPN